MDIINKKIYGNEKTLSFFKSAIENNKLAHAYIFEGGKGSGKKTLAKYLSCMVACNSLFERPCFMCESCRKIDAGISPDVITLELPKDKKTIGVEQIRELRSSVYIKPSEENVKIYIICNAETMTPQAQNVFLKVLEEPPMGVYFFMLCENTSNILATVKSRAPIIKMQNFSDNELSKYLIDNIKTAREMSVSNPDEYGLIIRISEGKIGEAQRLIADSKSDKSQSKHEKAGQLISLSAEGTPLKELALFVQKMASNREELLDVLLYAVYAVRDLVAVKKTDSENSVLLFYSNKDLAIREASKFTTLGVMNIYDELCRTREELYLNANLNNSLIYLASKLSVAARL